MISWPAVTVTETGAAEQAASLAPGRQQRIRGRSACGQGAQRRGGTVGRPADRRIMARSRGQAAPLTGIDEAGVADGGVQTHQLSHAGAVALQGSRQDGHSTHSACEGRASAM
jgi:hypothetical protein